MQYNYVGVILLQTVRLRFAAITPLTHLANDFDEYGDGYVFEDSAQLSYRMRSLLFTSECAQITRAEFKSEHQNGVISCNEDILTAL